MGKKENIKNGRRKKKVLRRIFRILFFCIVGVALLPFVLYIPFVQDFAKKQAVSYVAAHTDMRLSLERIRLYFPLKLVMQGADVTTSAGDTLARCGGLQLDIAFWPLLKKEVVVRKFDLLDAKTAYNDSTSGFGIDVRVGRLSVSPDRVDLSNKVAEVGRIELQDAVVSLALGISEPDTASSRGTLPGWDIRVGELNLKQIDFRMKMTAPESDISAQIGTGEIRQCGVDLGKQTVDVKSVQLKNGTYAYLTDPARVSPAPSDTTASLPGAPWVVRVEQVVLNDNEAAYGMVQGEPAAGFDVRHIRVTGLDMTVDSVYNRGGEIRLRLAHLAFAERSGLRVTSVQGGFSMDSSGIRLSAFGLRTPSSSLQADAFAGAGIFAAAPDTPLDLSLEADLNLRELLAVYPLNDPALTKALAGKTLRVDAGVSGRLDRLAVRKAGVALPGYLSLTADGTLESVFDPARLSGIVRIDCNFMRPAFLADLLPDTALRRRIALPPMRLKGNVRAVRGVFDPALALTVGGGRLGVNGRFDPGRKAYRAEIRCDSFPLGRFLPADSLGSVDFLLTAEGAGFDPYAEKTESTVHFKLDSLKYRGYAYKDIALDMRLYEHRLSGTLTSGGEELSLSLGLSGLLTEQRLEAGIKGRLRNIDPEGMGLTTQKIGLSTMIDASASVTDGRAYRAKVSLDSLKIRDGRKVNAILPIVLEAVADTLSTGFSLASGDLKLDFSASATLDSLIGGFSRTVALLMRQIKAGETDMDLLNPLLPPFRLDVAAGRNNMLNNFLKMRGVGFRSLSLYAKADPGDPFGMRMRVDRLTAGGVLTDTVRFEVGQYGRQLGFALHLGNTPVNAGILASADLTGKIVGNRGEIRIRESNSAGKTGFDFGLAGTLEDSLLKVSMFPEHPVLGFDRWTVNENNYVSYHPKYYFGADFRLNRDGRHVLIAGSGDAKVPPGSIRVDMANISIDTMLSLFPGLPPFGGTLGAAVILGMSDTTAGAGGTVALDGLRYDGRRIGDIGLDALFRTEDGKPLQFHAFMQLDRQKVLSVRADTTVRDAQGLRLLIDIPSFPLTAADAFLPADMVRLSGAFEGNMRLDLAGTPMLDGALRFAGTRVDVPMIGTAFGLSSDSIRIADNRITFRDFSVIAPNKQMLRINGTVDLHDFSDMTADLTAAASDFQIINVPRNRKSMVFGKASVDLSASVKGPFDELTVRANAALLGGTEVTYVMRDSPMDLQNKPQNVVTFVSFRDTTDLDEEPVVAPLQIGGMDLQANLTINEDAKMSVFLSDDGKNRITLQGGGDLTYTMNRLGDSRFAGRYTLTGGTVRYDPPIISVKNFDITRGGYVDWTGELADPAFNITAVETVRANVTTDDSNTSRPVNFDISIYIRNTLNDLSITFDLSAPNDLTIQNQLSSMTAEQRSVQAMNMLIYNTYSGPGTSAKANSENPLNSFIQKELNQWAQNNLKGVDLSFGIDTYNSTAGGAETSRTDYSYRVSKSLFNNQVRAVIGGKYSSDADPNDNLRENLIDDISLEYMFSRRDNMFLKVFRHTGYESILEGEITETGFGFVTRKKLQRLRDLFRLTRVKKERKKKDTPSLPVPAGGEAVTTRKESDTK